MFKSQSKDEQRYSAMYFNNVLLQKYDHTVLLHFPTLTILYMISLWVDTEQLLWACKLPVAVHGFIWLVSFTPVTSARLTA